MYQLMNQVQQLRASEKFTRNPRKLLWLLSGVRLILQQKQRLWDRWCGC